MDDSIALANISKELIAKPFTFASSLDETCDIHNLDRGRHDASWVYDFGELRQALIGYIDHAHIGLYGAEGKIGRLGF